MSTNKKWWLGRAGLSVSAAVLVAAGAVASAGPLGLFSPDTRPGTDAGPVALAGFDTCESALGQLRTAAAPYVGPYGFGGGLRTYMGRPGVGVPEGAEAKAAAPQASDQGQAQQHSQTNNQESGVDEPDLVKTDGKRVVTAADGKLRVVDVASRKLTGTVNMPAGRAGELMLDGDRALVITQEPQYRPAMPEDRGFAPGQARFSVVLVDLTGGARILGSMSVDGSYVDGRDIGGTARIVLRSTPALPFTNPAKAGDTSLAQQQNLAIMKQAPISDWVPKYRLNAGGTTKEGQLVECADIRHPKEFTGTSMLTVLTFDLRRDLGTGDGVSIVADGDKVYASGANLYVADDHVSPIVKPAEIRPLPGIPMPTPQRSRTEVHQFDIGKPGKPVYLASGQVDGTLLNQYSLSEHEGYLRVATTSGTPGSTSSERSGSSESTVFVLQRNGNALTEVGKLGGLGKGEKIYAVRFAGPVGYVVTFRQMDPLYTVDLRDPRHPRELGELKITGYSAYLHPVGDGKLLGVGQEASDQGRRLGTQVSLFDVSNLASPQRVAQFQLPGGSSEVEREPHAFLYWPANGTVVIPTSAQASTTGPTRAPGALVLRLSGNNFTELGTVSHPQGSASGYPGIRRSLVIGNDLWTVSSAGLMVSAMDLGIAQQGWVPFA